LLWKFYTSILAIAYSINIFLVNRLPEKWALIPDTFYMRCLVGPIFGPIRRYRLRQVFKKKNPQEIADASEAHIQFRIKFNAIISRSLTLPFDVFEAQNKIHGEENLQAALREGRGVLVLQAHYGNFYAPMCLLPRKGYDVTVIGVEVTPSPLEKLTKDVLKRFGTTRSIMGQNGGKIAMKVFKRNGIFGAFFDIVPPGKREEIVKVPLGDAFMDIYEGPARLASHCKVAVVPVINYCTTPFHSETYIEPAFPMVQGANEDETIQLMIKQWMDWFEPKLLAKPEQWWTWPYGTIRERQEEKPAS
jgi:lauroyl/myristoyl acyltransferase